MKVHISLLIIVPVLCFICGMMVTWKLYNWLDEEHTFEGKTTDKELIKQDKKYQEDK